MRVIEIRLDSGLLLIGSPGAFDRTMLNAADSLAAPALIRVLERNSTAMGRLRAELRAIYPALPAHALTDRDIVGRLRDELAAGRLTARLLRISGQGTPSIQLADKTRGIVHVPLADRTILIAPPGGLPPEFAGAAGLRSRQAPSLAGLPALSQQMGMLERQACRLPGVPAMLRGQNLTQFLDTRIAQGQLEWVVLDDRLAVARAAQRPDAPRGMEELDQGEKVAEAISRSRDYLGGAVLAAVEEMVRPENLAIMAAVILGVALAQLNPVSAAVVDGTLVILAWTFAGLAGIRAIGTLVNATVTAIDADGEQEIDAAARLYAEAFVGLGAAVLQALMARTLSKKGGKTGDDFKAKLNEGTGEAAPAKKPPAASEPPPKPAPEPVKPQAEAKQAAAPKTPPKRPSWRDSEKDVGKKLGPGYSEQKSFIGGKEVPYGTKGSTRPDWYKPGNSVEVKNYEIATPEGRARLVKNVSEQAVQRARDLPPNTTQSLVIDARGQQLSIKEANDLAKAISTQSQGKIKAADIEFLKD